MGDLGQRQVNNDTVGPTEPAREILSDDALKYVNALPEMQYEATQDPYLNGEDADRRLHDDRL